MNALYKMTVGQTPRQRLRSIDSELDASSISKPVTITKPTPSSERCFGTSLETFYLRRLRATRLGGETAFTFTKLVRVLGALMLLIAVTLPTVAQAQFNYTTTNGTITITRYTGPGGMVVIPNTINGLPVTSIGDQAFYDKSTLTNVTIPNSVINIGNQAFAFCDRLNSVIIPNSVHRIGRFAFYNCRELTNATIGSSVTNIGDGAFSYCNLSSVTIPSGVTGIGHHTFASCSSLTSVTIPNSVTTIGDSAFYSTALSNVTIASSITNIGKSAFSFCTRLTSITIPNSITSIGEQVFYGCTSLVAITVEPENSSFLSVDGVLFDKSGATLIVCPGGITGSYTIPDNVTNIESWAFGGCGLTTVNIPSGVTAIGNASFFNCTRLTSIAIPDSVTFIGSDAFWNCIRLASITLPNGIASIEYHTFYRCTNLTSVTIGSSATNIAAQAFELCTSLSKVYFQGNAPNVGPAVFGGADNVTNYYLPGATGWEPLFGGRPTALWLPQVSSGDTGFGVRTNQFGFNISWASGRTVVVEACDDLANPVWAPVGTNTLTGGSSYFSNPQWTNYPTRFYRLRSP